MADPSALAGPQLGAPIVAEQAKPLPAVPNSAPTTTAPGAPLAQQQLAHDAGPAAISPPTTASTALPAETDTDVLPVGDGVHPVHQAEAVQDAPDQLVDAQVEKVKGAEREAKGHEEQGTVVPGMEDDKLWAMRRRFDAQVVHVLSPPTKLPKGEPDLRPSTLPTVPFNSDLLKNNVERVYSTAGIWGIYASREMMRLMSWGPEDRKRTGCFCAAYFIAWWFSLVIPLIVGLFITLIVYTPSRKFLFPPVPPPRGQPPSATDPTNSKGDESMLAGVGHPVEHRSKAEQIEQQAWEFTNVIQRFGVRVVVGGHKKGHHGNGSVGKKEAVESSDDDDSDTDDEIELPSQVDGAVVETKDGDVKVLTAKQKRKLKAKEAKAKRDAMVGNLAKGAQDGLGDFADALERFANALTPPRPYPKNQARYKLAGAIFVPILLATAVVPAHIWSQAASFAFGVGWFGQPLLIRAAKKFVEKVPDWQEKLDLRNSIFSGVPTNAQLTLHLLRVSEASFNPIPPPPPPPTAQHVKDEVSKTGLDPEGTETADGAEVKVDEHGEPIVEGDEGDGKEGRGVAGAVAQTGKKTLLGGLRIAAKKAATFKADVSVEGAKEKVGNHVDRFFYQSRAKDPETPETFPAKLDGTSGHLTITFGPHTPPTLSFVPLKSPFEKPSFEKPVADLVEVKKRGVFIARAVLGWAASINLQGMGLEMRFKDHIERATDGLGKGDDPHAETHEGELWAFSHVGRRDELFARLISIFPGHKWEML